MRVSAYEQPGFVFKQRACNARGISAGIAADMGHEHVYFLNSERYAFGKNPAQILPVYVTVYGADRFYRTQGIVQFQRTYVARVPYFIAVGKEFGITLVVVAVRV